MGFFNFFNWGSFFSNLLNWFQNDSASNTPSPTVSTDKSDYAPGSTAQITASGFAPGSTVDFSTQIINPGADGIVGTADDTYGAPKEWLATDGGAGDADGVANGVVQTSLYVDRSYANTSILLSATQATVGADGSVTKTGPTATEVFTDSIGVSGISGYVYYDANDNGIFESGEAPIAGVTVTLTEYDSSNMQVSQSTTTTALDGSYSFLPIFVDDSLGHTFTLSETQPDFAHSYPVNYLDGIDTAGSLGGDTSVNDVISNVVLTPGNFSTDNNFGELLPSSLAGYVYYDANNDGNFDLSETPIPGTTVTLTGTDDLGNPVNASQLTLADGSYDFTNLRPGTYTLTETQPAGYLDGKDTQGTPGTGVAGNDVFTNITLNANVNGNRNNFGELLPASLGDYVWEDTNLNGLQDDGATGIAGATVTLIGGGADGLLSTTGDNTTTTTTTDGTGHYLFSGLTPGVQYQVQFDKPTGYDIVSPRQADANAASGNNSDGLLSDVITLSSNEYNPTIDSGFFKSNPSISIDKVTNDLPASGDGLTILSGEPISWTYTVTNTGNVTLSNLVVTDSQSGVNPTYVSGDTNNDGLLETNEVWTYTATGGQAVDGPYTNTGTVTADYVDGNGQDHTPTAHDDSNYLGVTPQITINKVTVDTTPGGASGDGLTILPGEPIEWDYAVTNTGDVALTNVTVTDDHQADGVIPVYDSGDNGNGILDVGETWLYKATGTAGTGPYTNVGTATGSVTDTAGHTAVVTATDGSGYTGIVPQIAIDKVTVDDSASGDGLTILSGENISWEYRVTNAGVTPLANVTVSDNQPSVTPVYVSGDDGDGLLETGETWIYSATGTSVDGSYSNTGTATGSVIDTAGHVATASATDGSGYTGITPHITIDKVTKDGSASGDNLTILSGESISWQYAVTNGGGVTLSNVTVSDNQPSVTPVYVSGDDGDGLLETGETWIYSATGTSVDGSYSNTGTATGSVKDTAGHTGTATATDGSGYTGITPHITIDKVTKDGSASGDNLTILSGESISWQYAVTNGGGVTLSNVTVSDNQPSVTPVYVSGDDGDGLLETGETWIYSATGTSVDGSYSNTGTATGSVKDTAGHTGTATATDGSGYTGITPHITIDKVTKDGSASGDNLTILSGESISWQYAVTNGGGVTLSNVTVSDNQPSVTPVYVSGDDGDGLLETGETWIYSATGTSVDGSYSNTGTATGSVKDTAGHTGTATATDGSGYTGITPHITIDKVTKDGAVSGDNLTILAGESIEWDYAVTNTGDVALNNVTVGDSVGTVHPTYVSGDDGDGLLEVGETWLYKATGTSVDGSYSNTGTATGSVTDTAGHSKTVTSTDGSGYTGINPSIHIDKVTKDGAVSGDNLTILAGESIEWDYAVTNTGDVALSNVTVGDSVGTVHPTYVSGDDGDGLLEVGETWLYKATGTSVDGSYSNTGTATGSVTDTAGHSKTVTSTDGSGYTGINPSIHIDKVTKDGAVSGDGITAQVGDAISWIYTVTNTGDVALSNVTVGDSVGTVHPTYVSGDANSNGKLDTNETWTYTASGTAVAGFYSNVGTATGSVMDSAGHSKTVTSTDGSSYTGATGEISITKTDGLSYVLPGQMITYTIVASNTGTIDAIGAVVKDNFSSLLTNVTWTSVASGGATLNDLSGAGNINDTVNLVAGSSITYTVHATVTNSTALQTIANFGAGTNNTNLGQNITIGGVRADAFYLSGTSYLTTNTVLWERDVTGDHGLGVWSNGEGDPIANGGDINELSNEKNAEVIRLTKAADQSWTSLWVSSLDSGGSGSAEVGTLYWSNSATPNLSTLTTKFTFKYGDFGAGVTEADVLSLAPAGFDPTAQYVFFVAGPNAAGTNNDYLVWKATTTATTLTNTATVTPPSGFTDTNPNNNTATDTDTIARPASLAGYVYYDANNDGIKQSTETGIGGATVKVTGTDDLGNAVSLTMTTAADGSYNFTNLRPGTYTITETQPAGYLDGKDAIGSQGGTTGNDVLSNISLGAGVNGVNNNFGELKGPSLKIVKSVTCVSDNNCDGKTDAGDVITFNITVTNTGTTTLTNVVVTDTLPNGTVVTVGTVASLAAGKSSTLSPTYTISQADIDSNGYGTGKVTDTATAKDTQGDNVSASSSTPISFTPGIDVEKLVSVDGGVNWYFTAAGTGPNATIALIAAETGISSSKLHIGTPTVNVGQQVQFKVVVTNVGDVTDHNVTVADVGDSAALNANFKFSGNTTITNLAVGASIVSDVIKTTAVNGSHTDVATATGTAGTGASATTVTAKDTETYTGIFVPGTCQQTSNWWCNNHYSVDHYYTGSYTSSSITTNNWNECTFNGQKGILLGDYTGTAWGTTSSPKTLSSIPTGMLFISDAQATDIFSASSSDPRLQVAAAAIAAQLNIDHGDYDPGYNPAGGNTAGNDLISEAVRWLTGKGSFTFSDGSTGKIDANSNGILDTSEYSTSTDKFSGTQQTTSGKEWTAYVDPNVTAKSGDIMVDGKDLLAALNAFNSNGLQLVTSLAGDMIGWQTSGGVIDIQQNTPTAFWSILQDQHIIVGHA